MMRFSTPLTRRALTAGASALASAALLTTGAMAQEATPVSTPGGPSEGYMVSVYQGTCAELSGDPVAEIGEAITFGVSQDGESEPETIGAEGGVSATLLGVSNTVDVGLTDMGNEGHVVAVEDGETLVSCGQVAGAVTDGELAIALSPVEGSTVVGVAILNDNDGQTEAQVYVFDTAVSDLDATPQATPVS
ncbi:MAG TPA: hypothetical protein VKZ61_05180 [Thermomicrobiales bacterium]|jgi:hypothetical protein|nr:hypothetical protein [Thermomicrobiales bacterium]